MKKIQGQFLLFLAFTLAGTSVIAARTVSETVGTFVVTAVSLLFALLLLLPLCRKDLLPALRSLTPSDIVLIAAQALFGIFLFRIFLLNGLQYTSAGEAGILTGATPAFTAVLALVILKEHFSIRRLAGIISTVGGILMLQGLLSGEGFSLKHLAGNMLVLSAALCEAVFNILSRAMSVRREKQMNPITQTALVTFLAFLFCLIPALMDRSLSRLSEAGPKEWLALLWYGAVVTAAAFICWYAGIKRCGALTAAAFSGMMPFTAMLLSALVLGERAGCQQWAGGVLVIAGMILIGLGTAKKEKPGPVCEVHKTGG